MKRVLIVVLILVLSYGILAVGNNLTVDTAAPAAGETLTGTSDGFGGKVSVTVTTEGDKIVDVVAEGPDETEGVGSKAIDQLPAKIVEANSTDVDAVTGATITSKAIIEAVNNALAGGNETAGDGTAFTGTAKGFGGEVSVTVTMDGDKIADVVAKGPDETEGVGSKAIDQLPAKIVEANSTDVDAVTGATITSKAIIEAVNNALAGGNETAGDGTALTGTAKGFGGEVSVTVTMDGDKIADVVAKGPDETEGVGSKAIEQLPAKIVEANSTDVDAVTGATITSKAIIEAVNSALESAK